MAVKMLDVAKCAGVSVATVSKYINGKYVREDSQKKVEKALRETEYRMNNAARNLKTKKSYLVGVLISSITSTFTTSVMFNIQRFLLNCGYTAIIMDSQGSKELEEKNLDVLLRLQVEGIILKPGFDEKPLLEKIIKSNVPVVLVDNLLDGVSCDAVVTNNRDTAYQMTQRLIEMGHRRIALCAGPEYVYTGYERSRGYEDAMNQAGLPLIMECGNFKTNEGYAAVKKLMERDERPTALISANYQMTMGMLRALREMNCSIPEDVSVFTFDEAEYDYILSVRLSSSIQPIEEISRSAVTLLLDKIEKGIRTPFTPQIKVEKCSICETLSIREYPLQQP